MGFVCIWKGSTNKLFTLGYKVGQLGKNLMRSHLMPISVFGFFRFIFVLVFLHHCFLYREAQVEVWRLSGGVSTVWGGGHSMGVGEKHLASFDLFALQTPVMFCFFPGATFCDYSPQALCVCVRNSDA